MRKLLLHVLLVASVSTLAIGLSHAFLSDTEISTANSFEAGTLDLKVDNLSYYNGATSSATTFAPVDLSGNTYRFLNFTDIKPGDYGNDSISLRVDTNDAWGCYLVSETSNDDFSSTEPELAAGDQPEDAGNIYDGELNQFIQMAVWVDDGNAILDPTETVIAKGPLNLVLPQLQGALADSAGGLFGNTPMVGEQVYHLGKAWCFGTLTIDSAGISCDGSGLTNITQTDRVTADITFTAIQSRNNLSYQCNLE